MVLSKVWGFGVLAAAALVAVSGCGGSGGTETTGTTGGTTGSAPVTPAQIAKTSSGSSVELTGAGSTFDQPLFAKAFYQYNKDHPDVSVNYQAIGSGGGIKQFTQGLVDFGASDVPMNATELKNAESAGGPVIQVPVALGAAAMGYNIPGVKSGLKLTPKAIADIYLGKVTKWNDPEIASENKGVNLPSTSITVVHRSDGSGTTYIFTDYLSKISPAWKSKVGVGKSVQWPAGVGGKGNSGVAGEITNTPGAIGYVELAYVLSSKMTDAVVQNKDGQYIAPSLDSASAAAAAFPKVSASQFSIVNASGAKCYPISGYSWLLIYQKQKDPTKGKALVDLMKWTVTSAQSSIASGIGYAPLPQNVQQLATSLLGQVQV
ncbi:MAG TPA: phosphate ABC transporter substrate-binding protein PstS [Armatimonadota bacterium]|nr:phosphate ABC transporter substrate-binding protein PstS [Armatimonadota bacterium]